MYVYKIGIMAIEMQTHRYFLIPSHATTHCTSHLDFILKIVR